MKTLQLAVLAGIISLIQVLLVMAGILQPIASSSIENIVFSAARLAVVAYAGVACAGGGLKKAAISGAEVAFASYAVIAVSAFAGYFIGRPVLGVSPSGIGGLALTLAVLIALNSAIGAVLAAGAAWVAGKMKR